MEPSEDNEEEPSLAGEGDIDVTEASSKSRTSQENEDTDELAKFRKKWKKELELKQQVRSSGPSLNSTPDHTPPTQRKDKEDEAASLYWMGVAAEQSGDMHAAIMYYRQAVQLEPDIEFKAYRKPYKNVHLDSLDVKGEGGEAREDGEAERELTSQLTDSLHSMTLHSCHSLCEPAFQPKETHISTIPIEIMRYILRWVVSAHLDMRSLEQISKVCKGFYMLAREPQLWRAACKKLWGTALHPTSYGGSWRRMFILKPHLHFNGVYISKTSYVRPGEHSLDNYYKPYHTVVYYRYLRFFPDGSVMYETSPVEPGQVVGKLCHKHSSEAVHLGNYTVHGDQVLVDVLTYQCYQTNQHRGRSRGRSKQSDPTHEQQLHMEFTLLSVGRHQQFNQLKWVEHYCKSLHRSTGQVQVNHFTIDYKYTPFSFSRVKRFTTNSIGFLS